MYVCMNVCIYIYIYVYMYLYTFLVCRLLLLCYFRLVYELIRSFWLFWGPFSTPLSQWKHWHSLVFIVTLGSAFGFHFSGSLCYFISLFFPLLWFYFSLSILINSLTLGKVLSLNVCAGEISFPLNLFKLYATSVFH